MSSVGNRHVAIYAVYVHTAFLSVCWCEILALCKWSALTLPGICLFLRGDLWKVVPWGHVWTLEYLETWMSAHQECACSLTAGLCFPFRWTSLGSSGAGLSTALFPAVIQSQWLPFRPLSFSYLLFFILVASFTQSRRSGYSFCVSGVAQFAVRAGCCQGLSWLWWEQGPSRLCLQLCWRH